MNSVLACSNTEEKSSGSLEATEKVTYQVRRLGVLLKQKVVRAIGAHRFSECSGGAFFLLGDVLLSLDVDQ